MTKAELIKALEPYPDQTVILVGADLDHGNGRERSEWGIALLEYTAYMRGDPPDTPELVLVADTP
jgi:hypothetical protein